MSELKDYFKSGIQWWSSCKEDLFDEHGPIEPEQLPQELKRDYDELMDIRGPHKEFENNLAEYNGKYYIALEKSQTTFSLRTGHDDSEMDILRKRMREAVKDFAEKHHECETFFTEKDTVGNIDTAVLVPWDAAIDTCKNLAGELAKSITEAERMTRGMVASYNESGIQYWSTSTGMLHRHGHEQIEEGDLPKELKNVYESLWKPSYMDEYLAEVDGEYGFTMEDTSNALVAKDNNMDFDIMQKQMERAAVNIAKSCRDCRVFLSKTNQIDDMNLAVFVPWDTSVARCYEIRAQVIAEVEKAYKTPDKSRGKTIVAAYTDNFGDGDQSWFDYTEYYRKDGKLWCSYENGYTMKTSVCETTEEKMKTDIERVKDDIRRSGNAHSQWEESGFRKDTGYTLYSEETIKEMNEKEHKKFMTER